MKSDDCTTIAEDRRSREKMKMEPLIKEQTKIKTKFNYQAKKLSKET